MGGEYTCPKCGQWQSVGGCGYMGDMDADFGMVDWICRERGELHFEEFEMLTDEQRKEYLEKQDAYDAQTFINLVIKQEEE